MLNKSLVAIFMGMTVTSLAAADDAKTAKVACTSKACVKQACDMACTDGETCPFKKKSDDGTTVLTVSDVLTSVDSVWKAAACTSSKCAAACSDSACKTACASETGTCSDKTTCCDKAACTEKTVSADKKCDGTNKLIERAKCVVKATLHGKLDGATDKSIRLVITVPSEGEKGVPILSDIPYCNRLFRSVGGAGPKVVVLQIPTDQIDAIQSKDEGCSETRLAPVIVTRTFEANAVTSSGPWGKAVHATVHAPKLPACPATEVKPARTAQVYQTTPVKTQPKCATCPHASSKAKPCAIRPPKTAAIVYPPPATMPVPAPYYHPPRPVATHPTYSPYYANNPAAPGCKCGTGCPCGSAHANNELPKWAHRMLGMAAENAWLKARADVREEQLELQQDMHDELMHVHVENARLEAAQEQREEFLEALVEASIEKAQLEAHVEIMEEREALLTEIAALRSSQQSNSEQESVKALAMRLDRSRAENAVLKAEIAELQETVKAISQKVANQPTTIQVH